MKKMLPHENRKRYMGFNFTVCSSVTFSHISETYPRISKNFTASAQRIFHKSVRGIRIKENTRLQKCEPFNI